MATTIDDLVVEIKADTSQLRGSLKQIQGRLGTVARTGTATAAAMGAGFASMRAGALGLAAGIFAVGKGVQSIAVVGAGFEDLRDSIDTVFGSIQAGDAAMQKIFEFAQTTPFQIETATKAFIALKSAGIEPSMEMLQTFADTASVSVDQLGTFEALIRTVQRSASGGMGLEELNMISDRGIDVLGILKEELNLTKDDIAEFGKTAEGAALMVDALVTGLNKKFGGAMESKMDNLSTKASNMTIAFKQLADEIFKSGLGELLKDLTDRLTEFANAAARAIRIGRGTASQEDIQAEIDKINQQIENNFKGQGLLGLAPDPADRNFVEKLIFGDRGIDELRDYRALLIQTLEGMKKDADKAAGDTGGVGGKGGGKSLIDEKFVNFVDAFKGLVKDSADPIEEIKTQLALIDEIAADDALMKYFDATPELLEQVKEHLTDVQTEMENTSKISDELAMVIQQASMAFTKDFVDSLMEGQNALDAFKNFSKNIVSQIIAIFLQLAVVNQILNQIFGAGTFSTLDLNTGKINKGSLGGAGGGSMSVGQPRLVGERGPELFIPNANGTLLNNMNTKNAMGGGQPVIVNQSINFSTGVVPTVRAEVTRMLPQIADVTRGAVMESAMRGGAFRRALQGG